MVMEEAPRIVSEGKGVVKQFIHDGDIGYLLF